MKTKEYEVKLFKHDLDRFVSQQDGATWMYGPQYPLKNDSQMQVKAKLIIEIPERKVTITESQFDEALKMSDAVVGRNEFKENLKARLFNQGGEGRGEQ